MKKLTLLVGAAVGYVLGARAGRERYDQIKDTAGKVRRNPRVQSVVDDVKDEAATAAQKAASAVKETVTDAVRSDDPPTASSVGPDVPPPGSTS